MKKYFHKHIFLLIFIPEIEGNDNGEMSKINGPKTWMEMLKTDVCPMYAYK